jgi:ABC-type sugar transport system ATPase subunit
MLFELREVDVDFGRVRALSQASLRMHAGERLALVGAQPGPAQP